MRRGVLEDIETIYRWRIETATQLRERHGTDQWSTPYPRWKLERWVERGATWMAMSDPYPGSPVIATVTVDTEPEPEPQLWTADEQSVPAWYMSKLNRRPVPELRGAGIGVALTRWCQTQASLAGVGLLRIDCWSTNLGLQEMYRRLGFHYIRTVPGVVSGALFDIETSVFNGLPVVMAQGETEPSVSYRVGPMGPTEGEVSQSA